LGGQAADLAAEMIERQLEGVAHVVADRGGGTAERRDEPDLRAVLRRRRRGCQREQGREARGSCSHLASP
jgi:hypothetical protein